MTRPVTPGPTISAAVEQWPETPSNEPWATAVADCIVRFVRGFCTTSGVLAALWLFGWLA